VIQRGEAEIVRSEPPRVDEAMLAGLAARLIVVDGVEAVTLGGSRARPGEWGPWVDGGAWMTRRRHEGGLDPP
jgi:hypothetical protein